MEYIAIFVDVLIHHKPKRYFFVFCLDNAKVHLKAILQLGQKSFYVLMKLQSCIILQLVINFSEFEPLYFYEICFCKSKCVPTWHGENSWQIIKASLNTFSNKLF